MQADCRISLSRRAPSSTGEIVAGAGTLVTAAIAAWMLCLVLPTGSSYASAGPAAFATPIVSNSALKEDRLDRDHAHSQDQTRRLLTSKRTIPVGCEAPFSRLAATKMVRMRCVTAIAPRVKQASVRARQRPV